MQKKDIKLSIRKWLLYHCPAILYAGTIIIVSSIPNLHGPDIRFIPFDKVAHFLEYALFSFLTFRSISVTKIGERSNPTILVCIVLLAIFASIDEYHQRFIPGRSSDFADFAFDLAGGLLILIYMWLRKGRLTRF